MRVCICIENMGQLLTYTHRNTQSQTSINYNLNKELKMWKNKRNDSDGIFLLITQIKCVKNSNNNG